MVLDTNILIAYLGGESFVIEVLNQWRQDSRTLFISAVTETELLSFKGFTEKEEIFTEQFLEDNFILVNFDRSIARIAAKIRQKSKIKFPDAAIAATAVYLGLPLVTRDIKDFHKLITTEVIII